MQQREVHQCLIYQERDFLHYLDGVLNLSLFSRIPRYGKDNEILKGGCLFCTFLSVLNISVINSHHLFLVSSHVFLTHQLYSMLLFLDLFVSFFLRFYENCHS